MTDTDVRNLDQSKIIDINRRTTRSAREEDREEDTQKNQEDNDIYSTPQGASANSKVTETQDPTTPETSSESNSLPNLGSPENQSLLLQPTEHNQDNTKPKSKSGSNKDKTKPTSLKELAKRLKKHNKELKLDIENYRDRFDQDPSDRLPSYFGIAGTEAFRQDYTSALPPYWRLPNTDNPFTDWFEKNKDFIPHQTPSRYLPEIPPYKPFNMEHKFKTEPSDEEPYGIFTARKHGPEVINDPEDSYDIIEFPLTGAYTADLRNGATAPESPDHGESATAFSIDRLNAQLKAMSYKIPNFSGDKDTDDITDFLKDLNKYFKLTKITDDLEKYSIMKNNLSGTAKIWLKLQPDHQPYDELEEAIKQRFQLTEQQKHMKKLGIYTLTQEPGETYVEFCTRVQSKGRKLNIANQDLLSVCLSGAKESLKPHLIMAQPKSIDDLLKLPLARNESFAETTKEFVNMADMSVEINNVNRKSNGQAYNNKNRTPTMEPNEYQAPRNKSNSSTYGAQKEYGQKTQWCNSCGAYNCPAITEQGKCTAEGKQCLYCNKMNHFANVCRARIQRKYNPQNPNTTGYSKPMKPNQEQWMNNRQYNYGNRQQYQSSNWNREAYRNDFRNGQYRPYNRRSTRNGYINRNNYNRPNNSNYDNYNRNNQPFQRRGMMTNNRIVRMQRNTPQ